MSIRKANVFYIDFTLELDESSLRVSPTEIVVSILPPIEDARRFPLEKTSDGRWEAVCFLEL